MALEVAMVAMTVFGMLVIPMMSLNLDERQHVKPKENTESPVEGKEQKKVA